MKKLFNFPLQLIILTFTLSLICFGCGFKNSSDKSLKRPADVQQIELLFLGHDKELHNSKKLLNTIQENLSGEGINLTYTENPNDIAERSFNNYDGIMIYANHDNITPEQEKALKEFVEGGKALIAIHSASFMFRNSNWYVKTVGAQFKSHGQGEFQAEIVEPDHEIMRGFSEFKSWDETYTHQKINTDIEVLMERKEGDHSEPWTWTRNQGKGRVFYTASGHDERTWSNSEFQKLLVNGINWAVNNSAN